MNAPMQPDAPEWLVTLLAEHDGWTFDLSDGTKPDWTICDCGTRLLPFGEEVIEEAHRAHVAAVVWAEFATRMRDNAFVSTSAFRGLLEGSWREGNTDD